MELCVDRNCGDVICLVFIWYLFGICSVFAFCLLSFCMFLIVGSDYGLFQVSAGLVGKVRLSPPPQHHAAPQVARFRQ